MKAMHSIIGIAEVAFIWAIIIADSHHLKETNLDFGFSTCVTIANLLDLSQAAIFSQPKKSKSMIRKKIRHASQPESRRLTLPSF